MPNTHYLRCSKCGLDATPHIEVFMRDGVKVTEREVGTSTLMRCDDCCTGNKSSWIDDEISNALDAGSFSDRNDPALIAYAERGWKRDNDSYATMCRMCCPTNHGTMIYAGAQ